MQEKDLIYTQHALAQNGRALRLEYYRLTQPDAHGHHRRSVITSRKVTGVTVCSERSASKRSIRPGQTVILPMVVIKRDNSRQSFDRNKVLNGMLRACEKRPVAMADLEAAADEIEQIIQNSLDREVSTAQIGELVMERLKPLDEVAYVRFASVYQQFADVESFFTELQKLMGDRKK